ncbi:MAG: alpha/beta hydrolase, partial [Candidatus Heimdallarchaeota archaeon]
MWRIKDKIKVIGYGFIIFSLFISITSILYAISLNNKREQFFQSQGIIYQKFSVQMQDEVQIHGLLYVKENLYLFDNNSVYTILLLNGINSRKEDNFYKVYQLVERNYAVISIEQRGHGESGGPSGFLSKEPYDMIEILDFIESNFQFVNITHIGLLGFSYGGGVGAILQAIDDRIYTSVLYHPLTSLNSLLENIPLQNLIGSTPAIPNIGQIKDAFEIANESNSHNLLLIHGTEDILIYPIDSINFYSLLNGVNRSDIELILRGGLDHGGNEANLISLKLSIIWFEYYYYNNSIDITNIENELPYFDLFNLTYPDTIVSEILLIVSVILLFLGMTILIIK